METGKAIFKLLKDSTEVGAICADRIYPELAQQDAALPFIVYTIQDTSPTHAKNSTSKLDTARVELFCVGGDYSEVMDLGIAVRGALDRESGTIAGVQVQSIQFETSQVEYDPDVNVYSLEQSYDVRIQRTGTAVSVLQYPSNSFIVTEEDGTPNAAVNKLVFSNGSVSVSGTTATIASGAGGVNYYVLNSRFNNTDASANIYVPFTGTGEASAFAFDHMFLCPFNGSLKEVHLFRAGGTNMSTGNLLIDFRRVTGAASSSSLEQETLNAPINALTSYSVTYSGAQVQSGMVYILNIRNATDQVLDDVIVSLVFEVSNID